MTNNYLASLRTDLEAKLAALETKLAALESSRQPEPSPELPTLVKISDRSYSVSETPVTVAQYSAFCTATDREMPNQPSPHQPNNPVTNVSWHDATAYCEWLSTTLSQPIRLPTEDEFEHFAGDHQEATPEIAVYNQDHIQPVRTKKPNSYGLYDVLGCVWEWQNSDG